jgi:hypothetical protein
MRAPLLAVVAVVVGLAAAPAAQAATAFEEVLKDYKGDANINPCKHSEETLSKAAGQVPNDIEQYAPDFPEALGNAIAARAQGACDGKDAGGADEGSGGGGSSGSGGSSGGGGSGSGGSSGSGSGSAGSGGGGAATPPGGSPGAAPPPLATPAPPPSGVSNAPSSKQVPVPTRPASSKSIPPVPIALLVILAGLLLLGGLLFLVTRWLGLDGHRIAGARHTWGEAGYRTGATWADFRDWLRVGR